MLPQTLNLSPIYRRSWTKTQTSLFVRAGWVISTTPETDVNSRNIYISKTVTTSKSITKRCNLEYYNDPLFKHYEERWQFDYQKRKFQANKFMSVNKRLRR